MRATHQRLYINVDHVATLRQARRTDEPDPVMAAELCERAGADGITAHLREDRRHIQDDDVRRLAATVRTVLNLEMALTEECSASRCRATLPGDVRSGAARGDHTEGGLDVGRDPKRCAIGHHAAENARASVAVVHAPDPRRLLGHTIWGGCDRAAHRPVRARFAGGANDRCVAQRGRLAAEAGLAVHAGHGLTVRRRAG